MASVRFLAVFSLLAGLSACPPTTKAGAADGGGDGQARGEAGGASAEAGALSPSAPEGGTDDTSIPQSTSEELTGRVKHLLEALAHDNPDLATDILFPRDAYVAARDGADPGKAWDARVITGFRKHIHSVHQRTKDVEKASYVSFELGHSVVQTTPRRRDWKMPLWKVRHSKLNVMIEGKIKRIEIAEMMGWRGAWYVTKLR
jgi:hypothetical protein